MFRLQASDGIFHNEYCEHAELLNPTTITVASDQSGRTSLKRRWLEPVRLHVAANTLHCRSSIETRNNEINCLLLCHVER
jgi:hypothetical protein